MYSNFPFKRGAEFMRKFESTKEEHPDFKALAVMPYRPSQPWVRRLIVEGRWRLLWFWPKGSMLFSKPSAVERFNLSMRCKTLPSIEHILALVFNDSDYEGWTARP